MISNHHIDLTVIIGTIIAQMIKCRDFLLGITYEYKGYVFNAFDSAIALICIARILIIIFGPFIDNDDLDDIGTENPID